jgi:EAL domain-containing protein (putative c-di-GMP-specific phosphodiesterase class I)
MARLFVPFERLGAEQSNIAGTVRDIDTDPVRRALASALVAFAADTGAMLVAEGVETQAELDVLSNLGVGLGQGYILGRPQAFALTGKRRPSRFSRRSFPTRVP